jgi:hypothetical protein
VNRRTKTLILGLIFGSFYLIVEMMTRWFMGAMVGYGWGHDTQSYLSLTGWSSLWMLPIGGLCGIFLGGINEWKWSKKLPVLAQALIGTFLFCLPVEFIAGLVLNVWLKLGIWDYSLIRFNLPLLHFSWTPPNILGQLSPWGAALFVLLYPFAAWLDDILQFLLYREGKPYHLLDNYMKMFLLR